MRSSVAGSMLLLLASCSAEPQILLLQGRGSGAAFGNLVVDDQGSVFIAGSFQRRLELDGCPAAVDDGGYDAFVAGLDDDGQCLWIHSFGSAMSQTNTGASSLAVGSSRVVVGGTFEDAMIIGDVELVAEGRDAWIASFSADGAVQAVATIGGPGEQAIHELTIDGDAIYVVGSFEDTAAAGDVSLTGSVAEDAMVWRFTLALDPVWAVSWGGIHYDAASHVVACDGTIFVSGSFFHNITVGSTMMESQGQWDGLLAALNPAGEALWAVSAGGDQDDRGGPLACAGASGVLWSGYLSGNGSVVGFDHQSLGGVGAADAFVSRVSSSGELEHVQMLAGPDSQWIRAIASRGDEILVAGQFTGELPVQAPAPSSTGSADVFAALLSWDQPGHWSVRLGSATESGPDLLGGMAVLPSSVWLIGTFSGELTVSSSSATLLSDDGDLFLARVPLP